MLRLRVSSSRTATYSHAILINRNNPKNPKPETGLGPGSCVLPLHQCLPLAKRMYPLTYVFFKSVTKTCPMAFTIGLKPVLLHLQFQIVNAIGQVSLSVNVNAVGQV